jgi:hypothetical protein
MTIDGGSAYPLSRSDLEKGMSLRDYIAVKAMQSFLTGCHEDSYVSDGISIMAYEMADAMLKEREKCK